jgi:hypothetical protein
MSLHRSHLCHIGGADQGHFFHPPRNPQRPPITGGRITMDALGGVNPAGGRAELFAATPAGCLKLGEFQFQPLYHPAGLGIA